MKKLLAVLVLAVLFLSIVPPVSWAVESEATGTGMSGTADEYQDLEKTLKMDRIDMLESRIEDLAQANKFLSERVKMLERSVNDLKDKVDRSFREALGSSWILWIEERTGLRGVDILYSQSYTALVLILFF